MKPVDSPDTCPPRSHNAKRLSIIEAAARVFCREGFAGANIDLIAAEAAVSRQTIYNHHGDKEKLFAAVVSEITDRINANLFETLATFPDHPQDLRTELVAFATRLNRDCLCNRDSKYLRKLIQTEGERYPQLFTAWREDGPARIEAALGARFARLAFAGLLDIDDPDITARHFLALINAEIHVPSLMGERLSDTQIERSASNAVRTFLRAFGKREASARRAVAVEA